jgi:hypothetical protein
LFSTPPDDILDGFEKGGRGKKGKVKRNNKK